MHYRRKDETIYAIKLLYRMVMHRGGHPFEGEPGDYLVSDGDAQYFLDPDEFAARFMVVDPTAFASPAFDGQYAAGHLSLVPGMHDHAPAQSEVPVTYHHVPGTHTFEVRPIDEGRLADEVRREHAEGEV